MSDQTKTEDTSRDEIQVTENVTIQVFGPDGKLKDEKSVHNLVTTVGKNLIADNLLDSPTLGKPTHMAVGTGTTAANVADTTLETELDRNALTSKTRNTNVVTYVANWAAGDATGTITEAGLFTASSAGNMPNRAVFSGIPKGASDTLAITWTTTVS
jgi:hypothetical protein